MYRYEYIDKIGRLYHRSSPGMSMGATVHQALFDFHTAGGSSNVTAEDLVARARQVWRSAGFADAAEEAEYRSRAYEMLRRYHEAESTRSDQRRLFLAEKNLNLDMGNFILTGRVDRIDEFELDGRLEIVDYKSGRNDVTEDEVRDAVAMTIYQLMARRTWPDRRVAATIHALGGGKSATIELTDEEIAAWEDELRGIGQRILESDYEAVRPVYLPDTCPSCDFYSRCRSYFERREETDAD